MKKLLLFLICLLTMFSATINSQNLVAGDIAIIGVNEDAGPTGGQDHSFSFIALTTIPAGEQIYFTEQGWNNNNTPPTVAEGTASGFWMGNSEGHYRWTAPVGGVACGTIIRIYENGSTNTLVIDGVGSMSSILSGSGWNLSAGDQVIAYYSASGARPSNTEPNKYLIAEFTEIRMHNYKI